MRTICDDWQCPARWSCRHFIGRSREYAAMSEKRVPIVRRARPAEADCCDEYERDKPRRWLKDAFPLMGEPDVGRPL